MKQLLQNVRTGALELAEVPAPVPGSGQVLVRNAYSVMSPGTEKLALEFARKSLFEKARSRPDLVRQVVDKLRKEGPLPTYRAVANRLDGPQALGYASAGIVLEAGPGVSSLAPGDAVACAGAGYASHAELVVVPENLVARVPEGVSLRNAAFATIGAIALQGLRVAAPTLGETAAVIGLGLIGQLTVQLARANGCRVLGIDIDPQRAASSRALGAEWSGSPGDDWATWSATSAAGHGADFVIIAASADSDGPLRLAATLCRKKGRIALVGAVPVEVERRLVYDKELELRMSTSYGPGRYDRAYEEGGCDYPLPYVRWTENRNLEAFLRLIAARALDLEQLDTEEISFEGALDAYDDLAAGRGRSLAAVFRYSEAPSVVRTLELRAPAPRAADGDIGVAFLGAGNYAKSVLLPALPKQTTRRWLVAATGPSAAATAERFKFERCGTESTPALADPNVDLVFVASRHDSHAALAAQALRAGKAVWLEKPAAIDAEQLTLLEAAARATGQFLTIGFNRRFSRHARAMRDHFRGRLGPLAIHYSIAAGRPPSGSWILDRRVGGGRVIGEVCHFVDLSMFLVGVPARAVTAHALSRSLELDDSIVVLLEYCDGSVASLEFLAQASAALPKERLEVSGDGKTACCENFRETLLYGARGRSSVRTLNQDKGQATALIEVTTALRRSEPSPFSLAEISAVTRATFAIEESARLGRTVSLA